MRVDAALRRNLGWVLLFSLFINLTVLAAPLYMLQVYDRVLTSGSIETLIMLTVLCLGLLAVMALLTIARGWLLGDTALGLDAALREPVFGATVLGRDAQGGTDGLRSLSTLRNFVSGPGMAALFDVPFAPLFFALLFIIHPVFGVIGLGGAALIFAAAVASELATRGSVVDASIAAQRAEALVHGYHRARGTALVLGMGEALRRRWLAAHEESVTAHARGSDRGGVVTGAAKFIRMSLQIAVLGAGAWLAIRQIVSPGAMIAASIIMSRALAPIEALLGTWRTLVQARIARGHLRQLAVQAMPRPARGAASVRLPKPAGRIAVRNVDVTPHAGARPILRQLSFDILPGEIVGVTGASGSGKSTLARLLTGQIAPADGAVILDGADVSAWPPDDLGPSLGYMPQDCALFEGTVAENIARFSAEGAAATKRAAGVIAAARAAGVHEVIAGLPEAYETMVSDRSPNLSGGQRQLIALARALYGDVRLVVLDEPSAHLDTAGRKALVACLGRLRADRVTAVVISHDPVVLRASDRLLVLRSGRLVRDGTPQEVLVRAGGTGPPCADEPKAAARHDSLRAEPSRPTVLRPRPQRASHAPETWTRDPSR